MGNEDKTREQLADELDEARQRLTELEAELGVCYEQQETFGRALAQELRGGLGLIISFAQVLDEYQDMLTSKESRRYLQVIARKGHKTIEVIDELLSVQTGPPPDREIEITPLDTSSVVAEAIEMLDYMIQEHRARITLPKNWPMALGYAPWIEEVWANYISNAIKYGGSPPRIELGATEQEDGSVRFWVRDNGDGLPPDRRRRLFTPFAQLDQEPTEGYGLGLVIVQRIMGKLGGKVGVESEGLPGKGCEFYFTLPGARL
jgi:signal transduction histidine kinase